MTARQKKGQIARQIQAGPKIVFRSGQEGIILVKFCTTKRKQTKQNIKKLNKQKTNTQTKQPNNKQTKQKRQNNQTKRTNKTNK